MGYRALIFLVVSCPRPQISVPLAPFGGIGAASRRGVLLKGANVLRRWRKSHRAFDKTGTPTRGVQVTGVFQAEYGPRLRIAGEAERVESRLRGPL